MEDFRISTTWRNHRKRKRLRKLLGADGVLAIEDLWSFAAELHTDGVLENMNASDMADEVDYPGNAEAMLKVFVDLRLIDPPDEECQHHRFHDWAIHQRWIVGHKKRSERARQAALQKHHGNQGSALPDACAEHAPSMRPAHSGHAPLLSSPFPDPSPDPLPSPDPKNKRAQKPRSLTFNEQLQLLLKKNIPEQIARDFLELRKSKRAPLTQTALNGIHRESDRAGISLQEALEVCCANGWQGFRADWYEKKGKERPNHSQTDYGKSRKL